jgi:hypothetical protein
MNNEFNEIHQFSLDKVADFSSFGLDSHDPMYGATEKDRAAFGNPPEHLDLENWQRQADVPKSDATQQWAKQFGSSDDDFSTGIATDKDGNIYLTGGTYGDLAGKNTGVDDEWDYSTADAWVAKYDNNGKQIWARQFGTSTWDYSGAIALDKDGNIYLTGGTYGDLAGKNVGSDNEWGTLTSDVWIAKYDNNGEQIWAKQFGSSTRDGSSAIATDNNGNVYLTGSTEGDLAGENANEYDTDAWVAKYDNNGEQIWAKQFGSSDDDFSNGIATDNNGNVYLTGSTEGDLASKNLGQYDVWFAKYDSNGEQIWAKQFGSSSSDGSVAIKLDKDENIYLSGSTYGNLAGQNVPVYNAQNVAVYNTDAWVAKYDNNGEQIWAKQFGSVYGDYSSGITIDNDNNVYLTGAIDGNFYEGFSENNVSQPWSIDAWVAKYDNNGEQIWTKQFGTLRKDSSTKIVTDDNGNIYLTGKTTGDLAGKNAGGYKELWGEWTGDVWVAKIDEMPQPKVSTLATDPNAAETALGKTSNPGKFTITRTGDTTDPLTVNYSIDGKAINGEDYQKLTGNIIIPAGKTEVSLPIEAIDNEKSEYLERVNLTLEPNFFYSVDTNKSATVAIADNDRPVISISAIDAKAKETQEEEVTNPAKLKVRRGGNLTSSLKVNYTVDGTATKDTDYQLSSTIIFAAGMDSMDLPVSIVDDAVVEGTETAKVNLKTGAGYQVSQTNSARVSIADNDK